MCISVDDLPVVPYGIEEEGHESEIVDGFLKAFEKHGVQAMGFVNEGKLYSNQALDSSRLSLLEKWVDSGHDLGNHTYSHMNYHRNSIQDFGADILKGEKHIKPLASRYGKEVKYFRHPYLRSGADEESSKALLRFLKENGYQEAPVTIDNQEYLFALAYARAAKKKDTALMEKIGESYLTYMMEQLGYYEKASMDLLGRNMAHTLLIHANYLNAQYLDQLLALFKERGYTFISQEEVLKDPAYQMEVTKFGDWGISWIQRWGMSKGLTGDFFKGEAVTPAFILEMTN
ncbi:MAG: polysaccharide deacetylase family protein [Ekhidna sp.]